MLKVKVSPTAEQDLNEGAKYYNRQQPGLGRRFEKVVKQAFSRIAQMPQAASFSHSDIRYKVMTDFPVIITYKFDDKTVYIIRVFNTSLHPGRL